MYHVCMYVTLCLHSLSSVQIFTQSFVISQQSKQQNWLLETARQTDLNMDDHMIEEVGYSIAVSCIELYCIVLCCIVVLL